MTCIVSLVDKGTIYMGGDSAGVNRTSLNITVRLDEKVFKNGPFLMGGTTSFRMLQLLRYKFAPPKQTTNQDDMQYMVTDFVDAAQKCLVDGGFGSKSSGGQFLVGYKGVLYTIDSDFQVGISKDQFDTVGCGADLSLGSLFSTKGKKPEDRIIKALEAAAAFSAGVCAPFIVLKQSKGE